MSLDVNALRILRETIRTYECCRSYTDQGEATVYAYDSQREGKPRRVAFATAFLRPDHLRFDVRELEDEAWLDDAVVCWDGDKARTFRAYPDEVEESRDLERALARAADLSLGLAAYVSHLLLHEPWEFASERRAQLLGRRVLDGAECHKLHLPPTDRRASYTLWIDATSHLIRRILEVREIPGAEHPHRVQTVVELTPKVDPGLSEELFDYEPPEAPPEADR